MPSLVSLLAANQKISKPQTNLLNQLDNWGVVAPLTDETRQNPYSTAIVTIPPLACALYDFIVGTRGNRFGSPLMYRGQKVQVGQWDRARYLYLELFPDSYYELID